MNAAKLIKLAPMIIMIGFLAYSGYSIQTSADDPEAGQSGLAKELDVVVHDIVAAGDAIKEGASGALRDPFQVTLKEAVPAGVAASKGQGPLEPEPDPLAEIVRRLNLGATFLQGREQMAIIDGRIYSKGQHLLVDGDNGKTFSKLYVVNVLPTKVILHADGESYVLVYSDQLGDRDDHARKGGEEGSQNGHGRDRSRRRARHVPEAAQFAPGSAGQEGDRRPGPDLLSLRFFAIQARTPPAQHRELQCQPLAPGPARAVRPPGLETPQTRPSLTRTHTKAATTPWPMSMAKPTPSP